MATLVKINRCSDVLANRCDYYVAFFSYVESLLEPEEPAPAPKPSPAASKQSPQKARKSEPIHSAPPPSNEQMVDPKSAPEQHSAPPKNNDECHPQDDDTPQSGPDGGTN